MRSLFDALNRLPTTHTSNHQACVLHPHAHCQSSPTEYWRCCSNNNIIILSFHLTGWLVLCYVLLKSVWFDTDTQTAFPLSQCQICCGCFVTICCFGSYNHLWVTTSYWHIYVRKKSQFTTQNCHFIITMTIRRLCTLTDTREPKIKRCENKLQLTVAIASAFSFRADQNVSTLDSSSHTREAAFQASIKLCQSRCLTKKVITVYCTLGKSTLLVQTHSIHQWCRICSSLCFS